MIDMQEVIIKQGADIARMQKRLDEQSSATNVTFGQ